MYRPDYKANINSVLGSYYIRYDSMLRLNNAILQGYQNNEIDVYVDLKNMLKKLYSVEVYSNQKFSICAAIINLAAHIRGYYRTRHSLWARIYLVYGEDSAFNHTQYYQYFSDEDLRENSLNKNTNEEFINSQLELVKILCAYINEVYYVRKKSDFSMFTYDNIIENGKDRINVIISKSKYTYQIPVFANNTVLFRPVKTVSDNGLLDTSFLVTKNTALVLANNKSKNQDIVHINPELIGLFWALNGLSEKHVHSLVNITRAVKMILDACKSGKILNAYNSDPVYVFNNLLNLYTIIDANTFSYRFYAIDLITQYRIYKNSVESKDYSWKIDLQDPETVKQISSKYFVDNPLDLLNL